MTIAAPEPTDESRIATQVRKSLREHVSARGEEIHARFGPHIGWNELLRIMEDRSCVRYPCKIVFDMGDLGPGEFAHPAMNGTRPEDGFTLYVHPYFSTQLARVPHLVLYQLVLVNYGEFASGEDAEAFASAVLGLEKDAYYRDLCAMADEVNPQ